MLKLLHIMGVVLFLGNIIVSAVWRMRAQKSEDKAIHTFSLRLIQRTDMMFTLPGVLLIVITGHMMAPQYGGIGTQGWIYHSYALLLLSALIWVAALLPIQRKQIRLITEAHAVKEAGIRYQTLHRWWAILGGLATLLPLIALYLMITHPA